MKIIEEWRKEDYENGKKDGITEGIKKEKIKIAKNMKLRNYPIEEIMKITKLNKETILNLV